MLWVPRWGRQALAERWGRQALAESSAAQDRYVRPFLKTGKTLTSLGLWGNVAVMWPSEDEEEGEDEQEKQEVTERDAMANKRRRH
jgi:hypothetical protein